jgi:hypothetical protein
LDHRSQGQAPIARLEACEGANEGGFMGTVRAEKAKRPDLYRLGAAAATPRNLAAR